jgi:hypothetical protein
MVLSLSWMPNQVLNLKLKQFGVKHQRITFPGSFSLTRWTRLVRTLTTLYQRSMIVYKLTLTLSKCQLVPKINFEGVIDLIEMKADLYDEDQLGRMGYS